MDIDYFRISGDGKFDSVLHDMDIVEQVLLKESMIRLLTNEAQFDVKSCSHEKRFNKLLVPGTRYMLWWERISINHFNFFDLEKI